MASSINASVAGAGGLITTADNTGILQLKTAGTTAVTVDASQNVGIGTTSPSTYSAKFAIKTSDQDVIGFVGGTTYGMRFGANSSFAVIDGVDAATATSAYNPLCMRGSQLLFNTGGTERMRINSSGSVLVGTTNDDQWYTSTNTGINLQTGGSFIAVARNGACFIANKLTSDGTAMEFRRGGSTVGTVSVTGSATAYNTSSDYRLKENVIPIANALDKVAQLKPVTYKWKADGSEGEGFIAHELAEVCPQAVNGDKDAVDAEGKPIYQGVDTSFLVATLTAAIKEQQTIINDLKARVTALEAK